MINEILIVGIEIDRCNKNMSVRAYAHEIGIPPSTLHDVLNRESMSSKTQSKLLRYRSLNDWMELVQSAPADDADNGREPGRDSAI